MRVVGIVVFVVGCLVWLAPGMWSWFDPEGGNGAGLWPRFFLWVQMALAGLSLMRHPKPLTTVVIIALITVLILIALSLGSFYLAISLLALQAVIVWFIHRNHHRQGPLVRD